MLATTQNQYFGTDKSVDPRTETMVKAEMIVSYNNLEQDFSMNKEEHIMSFDPKPVSLEEYNQSIRDSVNAFYEHAVNDNTISEDEAINETVQMSENYLMAVEDFQNFSIGDESMDDGGLDADGIEDGGLGL